MVMLKAKKSNYLEIYCRADHLIEIHVHKNISRDDYKVLFYLFDSRTIEIDVEQNYPEYKIHTDISIILGLINKPGWVVINLNEYFKGEKENENDEQEAEIIHY